MEVESVDSKNPSVKLARATFEASEIKDGFNTVYESNKNKVKIPGFRPGKATFKVFRNHVGDDYLKEEFAYSASNRALHKVLEGEEHLRMVGNPELTLKSFDQEKECVIEIKIHYVPEFDLPDPCDIVIEIPTFDVTEDDIAKTIDRLRLQHATMVPIDRPAEEKDFVYFKWAVVNDDETLGNWKEELVEVGRGDFVKDFDKHLLGVKSGETKRIQTKIDEEDETVTIEIKIGETKTSDMPDLNDEFAKTLSMESVDALKSAVEAELKVSAKRAEQRAIHAKLADQLLEKTEIVIPQRLEHAALQDEIAHLTEDLSEKGMTLEMYLKKRDITEDKLREELTPRAINQVMIDMILEDYATNENIESEDSEVETELDRYVKSIMQMKGGKHVDRDALRKNISSSIRRNKTLEFLLGKAQLKKE